MTAAARWAAIGFLSCMATVGWSSVAFGEGSSSVEGSGASLGGSLVVSGSPSEVEQLGAQEEARLKNPGAVAEREASRTKFEGLSAEQAVRVAGEVFPELIEEPAGGPPKLSAGQSIVGYFADNVAQLDLGEGKHGVIESTVPMAVETSLGQRVPVDLSLSESGGVFEPKTPVVGVRVPKRLGGGVSLASTGVSLTPVDARGASLGGLDGIVDGATVFFANTQTDSDTVVKATALGFEMDTLLRSEHSLQQLSFKVGLPQGASLVQAADGSGSVQVVDEGAVIAAVLVPSARDATGTSVPVSMSVSGDTVTLIVGDSAGEYEFPIAVDPTVNDEQLTGVSKPTRWKFGPPGAPHFTSSGWKTSEGLTLQSTGTYHATEKGYLYYETQGESKITEAISELSGRNNGNIESVLQMAHLSGTEEVKEDTQRLFPEKGKEYGRSVAPAVCSTYEALKECNLLEEGKYAAPHNLVKLQQSATAEGSGENIARMYSANVWIDQEHGPEEPTFNTTSPTLYNGHEYVQNVLYNLESKPEDWLGEHNGAYEVKTKDPGIGISYFGIAVGLWVARNELYKEGKCEGVQCPPEFNQTFTSNKELGDGEYHASVTIEDADRYSYSGPGPQGTIKVDNTPPGNLTLTGLPASGVINEAQYHLQAQAIDGKAPTPSSGVKSLVLGLDGYTLPGKAGSCTPGPCAATGEWAINGEAFGAGKHTLTLVATDYAGNIEKKEYGITVRHASSLSVGPGSVDSITGALRLSASDVSLSGGSGKLGVSRSYNSRQLTGGEQGPFGSQWSISVSGSQSVEQEPTGSVVLVSPDGQRTMFESDGKGGYIAPKGDENLVLEAEKEGEKIKAYLLKNPTAGTTVKYVQPGGAGRWVIASSEGALTKTNGAKETVEWERLEGVTRPKLALAAVPAGVTCSTTVKEPKELSNGCRALSFTYATETTATGEAPSEWKAFKGRLMQISFTAYNPSTKAMETKPVAEYAYDKQGRLRAEWDPRITPSPLKMTYGYDSEGHVVALNPPGQESWLLHYGTTTSDTSAGRLLSVTRPPAGTSAQVKEQDEKAAPVNTTAPALSSTSPVIGTTLSISSNGTWSNSPLTYSDSWEDCYTRESKETCTAIPGAVNSTYTPQARDAGYTLRAQVTAVNADGATVATTSASKALAGFAPAYLRKFGEKGEGEAGQLNDPVAAATDALSNVWVVDHNNNRVQEWSATGTWLHTYGKKGASSLQFEAPEGVAINQGTGNIYIADKGNNRIEELSSKGEYVRTFGEKGSEPGKLSSPVGVAIAPNGNVWVGDYANNRVDEFSETGTYLGSFGSEGSGNGQFKGPAGIAFSGENVYVVDVANNRVEQFSLSGQYIAQFGSKGSSEGQFSTPTGITTEPFSGDLYVADSVNNRIEEFSPAGTFLVAYGKKGEGNGEFSSPQSIAINSTGDLYVPDSGNNRVQELEPKYSTNNPLPEPPMLSTSAVSTIDYNVPISGTSAPHEMTKAELEKLGQTDDPAEPVPSEPLATAVFPPDEPMGWPAKDYKRARITYLDELGRTVNTATPSGGISTSEYNEYNEMIRSLSADNRAAALKESTKAKQVEVAELLDTKSTYSAKGTQLLSTLGPQHTVEVRNGNEGLANTGEEKLARNHVHYYYNEGAPGGETFSLVTKITDGAEYEGKESEVRTTTNSYSGQEGLGWLLRKPTSSTTEPSGTNGRQYPSLDITHITLYDRATGDVIETKAPASRSGGSFGAKGTENGDFISPYDVAVAPNGKVYVADMGNNRVDEFSATGEYVTKWGSYGSANGQFKAPNGIAVAPNGNVYVADTENNRVQEFSETGAFITKWGSVGTGNGQFKNPRGIAIAPTGNVYVADTNNDRVQEFSPSGEYLTKWGSEGTGNGQFINPKGIAVAPDGDLYVANSEGNRVQEFSPSGEYLTKWGLEGKGDGGLDGVMGIAVATNGNVFVVNNGDSRVQEFTSTGVYVAAWGTPGSGSGQLIQPRGVAVAATGTIYVADSTNDRIVEFAAFPATPVRFGGMGAQFREPVSVAAAPSGDVYYVADTANNRVQELSASGECLSKWGSIGFENGQFKQPRAVTVAANGNVYVADTGNKRIQEFSPTGTYITKWSVEGSSPEGIAVAATGNVYVADTESDRIEEFTSSGTNVTKWGFEGSGNGQLQNPRGIAVAATGNVYVADTGNNRIQEFTSSGTYVTQWGIEGSENGQFKSPRGIVVAASGNVYVADAANNRVQEFNASGGYLTKWGSEGSGNAQFKKPEGVSVATNGNVYVADAFNNRIQEFTSTGTYITQSGSEGAANGQVKGLTSAATAPNGNIYVADTGNNRVEEFSTSGEYLTRMGGAEAFKAPQAVAVAPNGNVYVADTGANRVQEFNSAGGYVTAWGSEGSANGLFKSPEGIGVAADGDVYVMDTGNSRIQEFTSTGTYLTKWGSEGSGNGQFKGAQDLAVAANGDIYVADTSNNRVQEFSASGEYLTKWGSVGSGSGQFKSPAGVAVATNGNVYVADTGNNRIQEFYANGEHLNSFGSEGSGSQQFKAPQGIAVMTGKSMYIADTGNNRVQKWLLTPNENARDSQTIYYTAGSEARVASCDNHPQWANLPCETLPATQPADTAYPRLPVVTVTAYNIWDEPETVTETYGSTTRTKKTTYDNAGRVLTTEETSSIDTSLPKVTDKYSSETGVMVTQSTTVGEATKTITSVYNTLGQLTEYTDADSSTMQYVYSGPANDDQIEEVDYGGKKGSQIYSYDPTTKALIKLLDVGSEGGLGAGTFTASYDVEGKMTSETYPNGMIAKNTFNSAGEATGLEYEKTTHCTEKCTWFGETIVPSIHGEALLRTSTLAKEEYAYDGAGRLTEVSETPAGKGCTTRVYAHDEESNRLSLTTTLPGEEGYCRYVLGNPTESHTYDEASRLIDTGVEYEAFGNQTKIPAADAGEHEITASFYVDNQIASQKQNGETTTYSFDPMGRTEKTVSEGTTNSTVTNHYAGPGEAISWTSEEEGKKWIRNVPGIDGTLTATQNNTETAVLQLHDLEGDIIATAAISETETKLLTTYNPTEFGVPVNGTPPTKYSWLGASGLATGQSSGAANPGGDSYVPQLGQPLQTQPVQAPGAYGNGSYGGAPYTTAVSSQAITLGNDWATGAPEREAARQKQQEEEALAAAEYAAEVAELEANMNAPSPNEGGAVGVDPPHILVLFTPAEAIGYGEALCNCSVVRGTGVVIEAIAHKIGVNGLGEVFEEFMESGMAEGFGKELLSCGRDLRSNSANRCALEIDTWEFLGQDTYFPTSIQVGGCFFFKKSFEGKKRGLHCTNGAYYKTGSY